MKYFSSNNFQNFQLRNKIWPKNMVHVSDSSFMFFQVNIKEEIRWYEKEGNWVIKKDKVDWQKEIKGGYTERSREQKRKVSVE